MINSVRSFAKINRPNVSVRAKFHLVVSDLVYEITNKFAYSLKSLSSNDAVTREAACLLGGGGSFSRVTVNLVLHGRQPASDTSQLHLESIGERVHLNTTQFTVHHARQEPDDASPLIVLHSPSIHIQYCCPPKLSQNVSKR